MAIRCTLACQTLVLLFLLAASPSAAQVPIVWQPFAGPPGGTVRSLAQLTDGTLFAATRFGLYKRGQDAGTWRHIAPLSVDDPWPLSVIVNTHDHVILQADTLLMRSRDAAETWSVVRDGLPSTFRVRDVQAGPEGVVYLATTVGLFALEPQADHWEHLAFEENVWQVAPFPDGHVLVARDAETYHGLGLFYSEDLATWDYVVIDSTTWGPPDLLAVTTRGVAFAHQPEPIPTAQSEEQSAQPAQPDSFLWRSSDGGRTWEPVPEQIFSVEELVPGPQGSIYAGTWEGVSYQSRDEGATWQTLPERVYGAAGDENDLYLGVGRRGVLRSSDEGATWQDHATGLGAAHIERVSCSPTGPCYAAAFNAYRTRDGSATWERLEMPAPFNIWGTEVLEIGPTDALFAAPTYPGRLYRSIDEGATWQQVLPDSVRSVHNIAFFGDTVWAAAGGGTLYRSDDGGSRWSARATPWIVRGVAHAPTGTLFLAVGQGGQPGVYRSRDDGANWTKVGEWPTGRVSFIGTSSSGTVFAGTLREGYYRSEDEGETWVRMAIGVEEDHAEIRAMAENEDGVLFVGLNDPFPLHGSLDDGRTWERVDDGLEGLVGWLPAYDLALDAEGYLYAALHRNGMARTTRTTRVSAETPGAPAYAETSLEPPFPNPASEGASVSYVLAEPGHAHLALYDLVGRRVRMLASRRHGPGGHEVQFDTAGLAPGTYFVRLRTPGGAWTQAMTVVR